MPTLISDPTLRVKKYATVQDAKEFTAALAKLRRGDHIIYHTGFLMADREALGASKQDLTIIRERARKAWKCAKDGKVALIQHRKGFGEFEYHAVLL